MAKITVSDFCTNNDGIQIKKYTLSNKNGMTAEIINFGAILTSLTAPDRNYNYKDVVLGFVHPESYLTKNEYFYGAAIGRFANRISAAQFRIGNETYLLHKNEGENQIHGGKNGFSNKIWKAEIIGEDTEESLELTYFSPDGEEGFPGNLKVSLSYNLTEQDELEISFEAVTDKATVVNFTTHSYFNLSADFRNEITDHTLTVNAKRVIPIDAFSIPLANYLEVENTPFDFRKPKVLGEEIEAKHPQLQIGKGYDHCFVLEGEGLRKVGALYHEKSGRLMEVFTDQPGIQLYTGNHLNGKFETKTGGKNNFRTGVCLETQHFPDSPNRADFPSTLLTVEKKYKTTTIYKFSAI